MTSLISYTTIDNLFNSTLPLVFLYGEVEMISPFKNFDLWVTKYWNLFARSLMASLSPKRGKRKDNCYGWFLGPQKALIPFLFSLHMLLHKDNTATNKS